MGDFWDYLKEDIISKKNEYQNKAIAHVSAVIFNKRQEMKMTEKEFADFLGVSLTMLIKYESTSHDFKISQLAEIADKLNLSFEILLENEDS